MKDRRPTMVLENGAIRYGIYDELGALLRYEYIRPEDAPTQIGTPLTKMTLLSDETAEAIGLEQEDPTVNDALAGLASGKQDGLTGQKGQLLGFDEDGMPLAQDPPEGVGRSMAGKTVEPTQGTTATAGEGAEIFNDYRERSFTQFSTLGNVACGLHSHAECSGTTASGAASHAEGYMTTASGGNSHAEGARTKAIGQSSHAEGSSTVANGRNSHAEGIETTAEEGAHAEGYHTTAKRVGAHSSGGHTIASAANQMAIGEYNVEYPSDSNFSTNDNAFFIVGCGLTDSTRTNAFRVSKSGTFAKGNYNASGADYAELFEWADGNPDHIDRVGRFVTLDGAKIRLAGPLDDYILGIVSGCPSVVGDVYDDQWQGMYLVDIFGRPIMEDVEVPDVTETFPDPEDPENTITRVIIPAHTERRQKLNPDYDASQLPYIPRTERPEWAAVGLLGKLVALEDGSCAVNGYCTAGEGGVATASQDRTAYRVMEKLSDPETGAKCVRVMILPEGRR